MSKPKELRGPDFTHGYPFAELRDGAMLLGHADGEPALLARRGVATEQTTTCRWASPDSRRNCDVVGFMGCGVVLAHKMNLPTFLRCL